MGQGGRIRVHYPGSSADPVALWVNPANFNNNGTIFSQDFTPPTNANSIQFSYEVTMDKGRLAFSDASLSQLRPAYIITRKTYALGGQTIATRISGDQEGESDGLYYIHSDHLGSTSVMSYGQGHSQQGEEVDGCPAHYFPFGDWRVEPSHELTDQGFTGQKHNMDLGLYYYNARFYLPGIGRFASADTIVPDPSNPQQYNRYTYTLNNPLRYSDPTGHVCYDHTAGPELLGTCVNEDGSTYSLLTPQKEIKSSVPGIIQNATPFATLPFDPSAYSAGQGVQGFGDTVFASNNSLYGDFGYLHPGIDVPLPIGTPLLALGDGVVTCGALQAACGQKTTSGGHGIDIYYDSCKCTVHYVHATDVLKKDMQVSAGQIVGLSGAGSDGYAHLHLEIRNISAPSMVFNPIYFFEANTWGSMNLTYMAYANSYNNPETRLYAIEMSTGFNYWNWEGSYPFVFTR